MAMEVDIYAEPYQSALLKRDMFLSLKFDKGYVHNIVKNFTDTRLIFSRFNAIDAEDNLASLGSDTPQEWNFFKDSNQNDIFYQKDRGYVLQSFLGIYPPRLRVFKQIPAGVPVGSLCEITITNIDEDTLGFVDGVPERGSPFDNPSALTEMFMPPRASVKFSLFNPEKYRVQPVFHVPIRQLEVYTLDPDKDGDREVINQIVTGAKRTKRWSPSVMPWIYDVDGNFCVQPTKWEVL
jgi:hypothetical protein